jgi:hypothetical protein
VKDNIFQIGRDAHLFPYGLSLNNSTAQRVTDNTFAAGPACVNGLCWTARGLNLSLSDGPELNEPIANSIYRNSFSNLSTGIYVQRGCSNTLLQCNSFRGPLRIAPNTISRADIEILIGGTATTANQFDVLRNRSYTGGPSSTVTGHGQCVTTDPSKAANNLFSYTTGAARSLLFINTAQFPTLVYNYTPAAGNITQPLLVTAPSNPPTNTNGGALPIQCATNVSFNFTSACPDPAGGGGGRAPGVLRALLATTTDFTERSTLLNELLRSFLHDTTLTHGVDSAITAVGTYGGAAYADIDAGLRVRAGYPPNSNLRATGGGGTATAHRQTTSLYDDVRALLAPYNDDAVAIAHALRTNQGVRTAMLAIANDTTTWGAVSAQAYLEQYLGYQFGPWYENPEDEVTLPRPTRTKNAAAAVATLFPNPATDALTIDYHLPKGADGAELVLLNAMGKACGTRSLRGNAGETSLTLAGLQPGIYAYRILVSGQVAQTGQVVKLP